MDCFLSEGIEVIFRLALALLLIGKQELLVQDIEGVIRVSGHHFNHLQFTIALANGHPLVAEKRFFYVTI